MKNLSTKQPVSCYKRCAKVAIVHRNISCLFDAVPCSRVCIIHGAYPMRGYKSFRMVARMSIRDYFKVLSFRECNGATKISHSSPEAVGFTGMTV